MIYKFSWETLCLLYIDIGVGPLSPKVIESRRLSKFTSSSESSSYEVNLYHPEIFVFFLFCVHHVFKTSSTCSW